MWMLTKWSPQHRRILIIKWIGWPILCILCLFPRHCCHCPVGIWIIVIKAEVKIICGLSNAELLSSRWTWPQPPLSVQSASSRYNTEFPIWHKDDQPAIWWQIDYPGLLPSWKGRSFIRTATDTLDINFLHCCQNYYPHIYRIPKFIIMVFHTALPLIKGLTSHQIKSVLVHWDYHVLQLPPKWASEYQAAAPAPTLDSHYLWSDSLCICLDIYACFQTLCHQGLPTSWDTICYTLLAFLDSYPLPARTASSCCRHHSL